MYDYFQNKISELIIVSNHMVQTHKHMKPFFLSKECVN